ncbi:hypothetical protein, partial [Staphylococcus aureus]|uniref:hypothetical protein n=1 Tax=Staphylococcus aureus TaxID=1280 RepID=UPI001C92E0CF
KDTEDFYITFKIIHLKQPQPHQPLYPTSTYHLTTHQISKLKQPFINPNTHLITLPQPHISLTNTPNPPNLTTITLNINKPPLTKSFPSNLPNINFLRSLNFAQDYTLSSTNPKIPNPP